MDPASILADVTAILSIGNLLVDTAEQAIPWFIQAYDIATGKTTLTDAERAANLATEAQLRADLNAASIAADAP